MGLQHPAFKNVGRIRRAAMNSPAMGWGERGPAVTLLQGALVDLGYKLPISLKKGVPDGVYGNETLGAVKKFQSKETLKPDGVAGRNTWAKLDARMVKLKTKKKTPSKPLPVAPPPTIVTTEYQIGTTDPPIIPDVGSGPWNTEATQLTYVALKGAIVAILPAAAIKLGDDAAKHMLHFFGNTGSNYTIDLEGMIAETKTPQKRFESEVGQAKTFVEMLPPGVHNITSRKANGAYVLPSESKNWFYAIGGFSTWGKGRATVTDTPAGRQYVLEFEYKFFDRYNWDGGKKVDIDVPGWGPVEVTDEFLQNFHRQGLAREFNSVGSIRRTFRWKKGDSIPSSQFQPGLP